jgi:hypothetical protein
MITRQLLMILIDYFNYSTLRALSKAIQLPEYVYDVYLNKNYDMSYSSFNILELLNKNSIKFNKNKRDSFNGIDFDTNRISRVFQDNFQGLVFSTFDGKFYKYEYYTKRMSIFKVYRLIKGSSNAFRIRLNKENGYYSLKQIKKFNINDLLTFDNYSNVNGMDKLKSSSNNETYFDIKFDMFSKFIDSYHFTYHSHVHIHSNDTEISITTIFRLQKDCYIFYQFNKLENSYVVIGRETIEKLLDSLTKDQLRCIIFNYQS